ncbi:MAG: hypothetical protein DI584_00040 [Stenotrophomonas sp.]|nr:MAG: hypothetical protein DI584_00040 [Stenotrophomonas sp.]
MTTFEHHFPFHLLPKLRELPLRRFDAAAEECTLDRQVPPELAYFTAATACCAAAQALVDVTKPAGGIVGTNVYALISAPPGERKTDVRRDFFGAFDQVDVELKADFTQENANYEANLRQWVRKEKSLAHDSKSAKGLDNDEILKQMDDHDMRKPAPPIEIRASLKEPGIASLKRALTNFPCLSIVSGDCAVYLRDVVLPNDTMLCDTWSGEKIDDPRITVASYYCEQPRLTILLMIQPDKFTPILNSKSGQGAIASGYFGRTLYCEAVSKGGRFLDFENNTKPIGSTHRDEFTRNIKALLLDGVAAMRATTYKRRMLRFDAEASTAWTLYYNYVEEQRRADGRYHRAGDFASKLPDNVARMAAAFHVTERLDGDEIGMECLMTAILIWDYSSDQYVKKFAKACQDEADADYLYDWLYKKLRSEPVGAGERVAREHTLQHVSTLSQYAPCRRMRGRKIHDLLSIMVRKGLISIHVYPVGRGQTAEKIRLLTPPPQ